MHSTVMLLIELRSYPLSMSKIPGRQQNALTSKRLGLPLFTYFLSVILTLKGLLIVYLLCWAVVYRLPHSPPALVDHRASIHERPYYVAICAGLASNIHGFPGHGYVVWSESLPMNFSKCESRGFVPAKFGDQIPSLFRTVPGLLVSNATDGNLRNFDSVVVIVDKTTYDQSKQISRGWKADNFKVGSSDCVAYANSIALKLGLIVPKTSFKYPQDYIAQLKRLNRSESVVNCTQN